MTPNLKFKISNSQQGMTLIITFLMMTIMLSIVMGVSTILLRQVNAISDAGNSLVAFDAAKSGLEKTLYLEKFQAGRGGLCGICKACDLSECKNCQAVAQAGACEVWYDSAFDGKTYRVHAIMTAGKTTITSQGFYRDSMRQVEIQK